MHNNHVVMFAKAGLMGVLLGASPGYSQDVPRASQTDINQMRQQLDEQAKKLAAQQNQLDEELRKLEEHKRAFEETRQQLEALQKRLGVTPASRHERVAQTQAQPVQPVGRAPEKQKDAQPPEVAQLFEQPGVLTPKGSVVLEPSLQYSYSSSNRVSIVGYTIIPALVIGLIDVRSVNRSTWVAALTGRYGLTNRLEIEAKIPYVYRNDDTISRPLNLSGSASDSLFNASGHGIGDIELAARYQLNIPAGDDPYYIAGLRFKTHTGTDPFEVSYASGTTAATGTLQTSLPTGSGFYGIQPSLSVIYPSDPAVFFGGINYLWNIKRDVNKMVAGGYIGSVDPGDAIGFNFGMGMSLNEKSAFSLGYEQTWIGKTKQNGVVPQTATSTQLASLLIGYSYRLNKKSNLNVSIAAGLTPDTPNTQLTLRIPYSF
jgi:hypothetical protein